MKKKMLMTLLALSVSVMMIGCGTTGETGKENNSQVETSTEKNTEEKNEESTSTQEESQTEESTKEEQSEFESTVMGKYWITDYEEMGYYFDKDKVIIGMGSTQTEYSYTIDADGNIDVDGEPIIWEFVDGQLWMATPPFESFPFEEVDKDTFDGLFQ